MSRNSTVWAARRPALANWGLSLKPVKWLHEKILHVDRRRDLPPFAAETFGRWFASRRPGPRAGRNGRVVLFDDCFLNYIYPQVGRAAVEVLEAAGFAVHLAAKKCCGRPMLSKGLIEDAREAARHNVKEFEQYAAAGVPVVGCEPSCLLTFRDEYADLVPGEAPRKVAANSWMLDEFLVRLAAGNKLDLPWKSAGPKVLFHGHCHQKAHIGSAPSLAALRLAPGRTVEEIDSGCCGMAGSFGFEKGHYEISQKIGEERLFPAVEEAENETEIAVSGVSCRQQIDHFTSRKPRHVVEILRDSIAGSV